MACEICGAPTKGKRLTCSKQCRYLLVAKRHRENGTRPPPQTVEWREASRQRMTGSGCPRWNGGKYLTHAGYLMVRPPADYPHSPPDKRGYIREHRMVMEMHLGRALRPGEVVHHLNGDKIDNRIENLEVCDSQSEHITGHSVEGAMYNRWPKCIMGCGRQAKPLGGRRFLACARCRRLASNRGDPRIEAVEDWPAK